MATVCFNPFCYQYYSIAESLNSVTPLENKSGRQEKYIRYTLSEMNLNEYTDICRVYLALGKTLYSRDAQITLQATVRQCCVTVGQ